MQSSAVGGSHGRAYTRNAMSCAAGGKYSQRVSVALSEQEKSALPEPGGHIKNFDMNICWIRKAGSKASSSLPSSNLYQLLICTFRLAVPAIQMLHRIFGLRLWPFWCSATLCRTISPGAQSFSRNPPTRALSRRKTQDRNAIPGGVS